MQLGYGGIEARGYPPVRCVLCSSLKLSVLRLVVWYSLRLRKPGCSYRLHAEILDNLSCPPVVLLTNLHMTEHATLASDANAARAPYSKHVGTPSTFGPPLPWSS